MVRKLAVIRRLFSEDKLTNFIADKAKMELDYVTDMLLSNIDPNDVRYGELLKYKLNHRVIVNNNQIWLYNNSMADIEHLSEKTKINYPNGLSLAKLIEYGTGIVGQESEASAYAKDWQYCKNPKRDYSKYWVYEIGGNLYWSKGVAGQLVYFNTKLRVESKINNWIEEYIEKELGGVRNAR